MSGKGKGKIHLGKADVYLHVKGKSKASVTHLDIELDKINDIIYPGEATYCGGKMGGVFLGLKKNQIVRADAIARNISEDQNKKRNGTSKARITKQNEKKKK